MNAEVATAQGNALAPAFERARVRDVMRHGVISCEPETPVRDVARIMASYHVHCVGVALGGDLWGIVSAEDVLAVAGTDREELSAGEIAGTEFVTVSAGLPLGAAAQLMREHEVGHVIVTGPEGRPIGVVSTLDVAETIAWGRA